MILVNTDYVEGKKIVTVLGLVKGNTIRAKWIGKDIISGLRHIVGGELKEYTNMLSEARDEAIKRMVEEAEKLGANAILNIRFQSSEISAGAAEILAYGTAVKLE
ncbi:MAG TPA: YbjQ family protein [Methanosarcinales archaeon]|nr:YbjQ family protein [Methanosarcinales archaeon]